MFGILLDYTCAVAMVLIPLVSFPLLKRFDERSALGYVGFRCLEGGFFVFLAIWREEGDRCWCDSQIIFTLETTTLSSRSGRWHVAC